MTFRVQLYCYLIVGQPGPAVVWIDANNNSDDDRVSDVKITVTGPNGDVQPWSFDAPHFGDDHYEKTNLIDVQAAPAVTGTYAFEIEFAAQSPFKGGRFHASVPAFLPGQAEPRPACSSGWMFASPE